MTRGTITHKLTEVIQVLQMAHKTGTLFVNRDGAGNQTEQGSISYHSGQIIDAMLGPYRGSEALQRLQMWGSCYFTFQSHAQPGNTMQALTQMIPVNDLDVNNHSGPLLQPGTGSGPLPVPQSGTVPQRLQTVSEVLPRFDRLGLTRLHRQVFLLIDGRRTIPEITRLTGRRTDEVNKLLRDLAHAGLIHW